MSALRTFRSLRVVPPIKRGLHSSSQAPQPSHLLSSQRDSPHANYASLTVNALKQECRQRGLKLGGRKNDLVERLVGFDQAKSFSSTADALNLNPTLFPPPITPKAAVTRAFSTTLVDNGPQSPVFSVPKPPPPEPEHTPVVKIPVGPNRGDTTAIYSDLSTKTLDGDTGRSAGDIHVADGELTKVSTMNVDLGSGAPQHFEEEHQQRRSEHELPARDKPVLLTLGAVIAAWWGSKWYSNDTEE